MDNTFFQKLRDIQKKERNTGTLSEIEDTFYDDASNYLHELLKTVDNNPLSLEAYQLHDAQRITIEICERREFKIISTALANVQKSHDIFKGHRKNSELYDIIPYNTTPEEEKLYKDIINLIIVHREEIMHDFTNPKKTEKTFEDNVQDNSIKSKVSTSEVQSKELSVASNSDELLKTESKEILESTEVTSDTIIENKDEITQKTSDIKAESKEIPESTEVTSDAIIENKDEITQKTSDKPKLSASQVAQMFGQAPEPDYIPNVIEKPSQEEQQKPQNIQDNIAQEKTSDTVNINNKIENTKESTTSEEALNQSIIEETENKDNTLSEVSTIEDNTLNEEELVVFKEDVNTDILDMDEVTYGPFDKSDMAILPESIVKILKHYDIIEIVK